LVEILYKIYDDNNNLLVEFTDREDPEEFKMDSSLTNSAFIDCIMSMKI